MIVTRASDSPLTPSAADFLEPQSRDRHVQLRQLAADRQQVDVDGNVLDHHFVDQEFLALFLGGLFVR